jgi:hypothetical protein
VEIKTGNDVDFDPVDAPVAKDPRVTQTDSTERRIGW